MTKETEAAKPKAEKAVEEKVVLRNRDIRGVEVQKDDGSAVFVGPKKTITILKSEVSKQIKDQIASGLLSQEE